MRNVTGSVLLMVSMIAGAQCANAQSIEVTAPAGDERIPEGRAYGTWELGNRWDMRCPDWSGQPGFSGDPIWDERFTCDLIMSQNRCVTAEQFSNGLYQATSTSDCNTKGNADPNLIFVSPAPPSGVGLSNGRLFPIPTALYRHFTAKVRLPGASSSQGSMVFFSTSGDSNDPFGRTGFKQIAPGEWQIVTFDMIDDGAVGGNATLRWDDQDEVIGLRYDPVPNNDVNFEIDWARLSADPDVPGTPDTSVLVEWTASGFGGSDTFTISAVDTADGAALALAAGLESSARSATVDLSRLAPGDYVLEVRAGDTFDLSPGTVSINSAPEAHVIEPDKRGDESRDYALDELGDAWGPMNAEDIIIGNDAQTNLNNIQFIAGELHAEAPDGGLIPGDPRMTFDTPVTIDTSLYRMLSYEFRLEIPAGQLGTVARVFWGTDMGPGPTPDTASDDIRNERGFNTFVLGDMRKVPDKDGIAGGWNGDLTVLRFDPHEVNGSRDIVFRNMRVRPLDTASPIFTISWDVADPNTGDPLTIGLYYDEDQTLDNGNATLIASGIDGKAKSNFVWDAGSIVPAEYFIQLTAHDGLNTVRRYASGPIKVTDGSDEIIFTNSFE